MSSPNDVNVGVRFTANNRQITQMFTQMQRLQAKVKQLSKSLTKLGTEFKKLGSRFDTSTRKISKLNKTLTSQAQKQDRVRSSVQRLTKGQKGYAAAVDKTDKTARRGNKTLGFTGLAFGFIGGIAGFAANQIRTQFISVLEETASIMSEISRITLFSDTGVKDGIVSLRELERQTERVLEVGRNTGIAFGDVAELLKNVEKAAPPDLDVNVFGNIVSDMKLLENELDTTTIAADIITIKSNFDELSLEELTDQVFTFGKANKLTFSASAKAVGFAAQGAKLLGSDLEEVNRVLTVVSNRIPGFQGNAGRGLRRLETAFSNDKTVAFLASTGVNLIDTEGRFIGLESAITKTADKFKEFNAENQLKGAQFLRLIGLTENARLTLLAYADASDEAKEAVRLQFAPENVQGSFNIAAEFQKTQPEAVIGKLKNQITELKIAFTSGLFPALSEINDIIHEAFGDKELVETIKQLGKAIGEGLVVTTRILLPFLKVISAIFKNNEPLIRATAAAFILLTGALTAMSIVFPLLGGFFALIFLHEKLIDRSARLGKKANFVTKAYVKMFTVMKRVASSLVNIFKSVGGFIFRGLTAGLRFIAPAFLAAGARAGAFFGAAFNILSNAFIFVGGFVKTMFARISALFVAAGTATGTAFGGAFNAATLAVMRAGAWITGVAVALGIRFTAIGTAVGSAFGGSFTVAAGAVIRAAGWIQAMLATLSKRFAFIASGVGAAFGSAFTFAAGAFMRAGAWISAVFANAKVVQAFRVAGGLSGTTWGTAFATGALAAISIGLGDLVAEILFGKSVIRDTTGTSIGDVARDAGVPVPKEVLGGEPGTVAGALKTNRTFDDFINQIAGFLGPLFNFVTGNLPEAAGAGPEDDKEVELKENLHEALTDKLSRIIEGNKILDLIHAVLRVNTSTLSANTLKVLAYTNTLDLQIVEVIKNINIISAMTTKVSEVNLMFTKLVAEGNRAAGKLASLRVSTSGKFSIRDPGISTSDRAAINAAASDLVSTQANQSNIAVPFASQIQTQNNSITVNPSITINNAQGLNTEELVELINIEFAKTLQKNVSNIIS